MHRVMLVVIFVVALTVEYSEAVCYLKGKSYSTGDVWKEDGQCLQNTCTERGTVTKKGCPLIQETSGDYYLTDEDPELSYPQCCPHPEKIEEHKR